MIVLERKKILIVFGLIAMFIFAFMITGFNINNASNKNIETVETVALPVDKKVIIIDAGHGIPDEGAQSSMRNNRGSK